jgi:UDP-N-acetylglucosamine/UDP-N-acetylgalactosamine diphosphorylase
MNGILELESAPRFIQHSSDMEELYDRLKSFQQEHLLHFWPHFNDDQKHEFAESLKNLDFRHVQHMFQQTQESSQMAAEAIDLLMKPVPEEAYGGVNRNSAEELAEFQRKGLEAVSRGEVAVVLLAGIQRYSLLI